MTQERPLVARGSLNTDYRILGDDEDMNRGLGVDVPEGHAAIVLVDYIRRNLSPEYLAEYGVIHLPSVPSRKGLRRGKRSGALEADSLLQR